MLTLADRLDVVLEGKASTAKVAPKAKSAATHVETDSAIQITLSLQEMGKLIRRRPVVLKLKDPKGNNTYDVTIKYGGKSAPSG